MMNWRKRFIILGLLVVFALAVGVGLVLSARATRQPPEQRATYAIAQAYLAAVVQGDKRAALRLYRADALCSGADPGKTVDAHIAMLASSQVRTIQIDVHSADGTGYPPGSQGAEIKLVYKSDRVPWWRLDTIWVVTGPPGADGERFICHWGGGQTQD
jgi:hypothetical protein